MSDFKYTLHHSDFETIVETLLVLRYIADNHPMYMMPFYKTLRGISVKYCFPDHQGGGLLWRDIGTISRSLFIMYSKTEASYHATSSNMIILAANLDVICDFDVPDPYDEAKIFQESIMLDTTNAIMYDFWNYLRTTELQGTTFNILNIMRFRSEYKDLYNTMLQRYKDGTDGTVSTVSTAGIQ